MTEYDDITGWHFDGYQQWTELFARRGYNGKNFTFVVLEVEYSDHLYQPGYFELHVGFMGVGFWLRRFPGGRKTVAMAELQGLASEAAARPTGSREEVGG